MSLFCCLRCPKREEKPGSPSPTAPLISRQPPETKSSKLANQIFLSLTPDSFSIIFYNGLNPILEGDRFGFTAETLSSISKGELRTRSSITPPNNHFVGTVNISFQLDRESPRVLITGTLRHYTQEGTTLKDHEIFILTDTPTKESTDDIPSWIFNLQESSTHSPNNRNIIPGFTADTLRLHSLKLAHVSLY